MGKNNTVEVTILGKDKASSVFKGVIGAAAALAAAVGGAQLAKSFVEAASTSENLRIRMNALMGSASEGGKVFDDMAKFASKVPFEYEAVMSSATQLAGAVKGGSDEISKTMPMIADLAAVSGLTMEETTSQVVRMFSSGAGAADLFRERGINAMLGFEAGVAVSAEETKKRLIEAWESPTSRFKGASGELANTWTGIMSMMGDKWFQFRNVVMDSGIFNALKQLAQFLNVQMGKALDVVTKNIDGWAVSALTFFNMFVQALNGIVTKFNIFTKEGFSNFLNAGRNALGSFIDMVIRAFPMLTSFMIEVFRSAFESIFELGKVAFEKLFDIVLRQNHARTFADVIFEDLPAKLEDNKARFKAMFDDVTALAGEKGNELQESIFGALDINFEAANAAAESMLEKLQGTADVVAETNTVQREEMTSFMELLDEQSKKFFDSSETNSQKFAKTLAKTIDKTTKSISDGVAGVIVEGGNLMDVFKNAAKEALKQVIASLIQMQIQRMVTSTISQTAARAEFKTQGSASVGLAGANAVATTAAAPWPINLTAPAVGAAMSASAAGLLSAGAVGQFHDGVDFVPREGSFMLDKGERVLSPVQNRDLTDFLGSGGSGSGGSTTIENLNVTLFDSSVNPVDVLTSITERQLEEFVLDRLVPALDRSARRGVRPTDSERRGDV